MSMMHMPWVLVVLMAFILVVAGGAYLAIRVAAAGRSRRDHPYPPRNVPAHSGRHPSVQAGPAAQSQHAQSDTPAESPQPGRPHSEP